MGTNQPFRLIIATVVAAVVSGCGILPRVAQQTTAAAIAPIATTARVVSANLRAVSQNMAASSLAAERSTRQVSQTAARTRNATRAAQQRRAYSEKIAKRNEALKERLAQSGPPDESFDILPAPVLAQLTVDQAALQRAAQKAALTAPVGETIYWENADRIGTAMAETEEPMGGFVCRMFVQTVLIDAAEQRGTTLACKTQDGAWAPSPGRMEFVP